MNTVKVSTKFAKTIRVKNKTFVLFLKNPSELVIYGPGIDPGNPLILEVHNTEEEFEFDYTDEFIWNSIKEYKKRLRKSAKN